MLRQAETRRRRIRWNGLAAALLLLAGALVSGCRARQGAPPAPVAEAERLYAQGREHLRRLDAVGARDRLAEAVAADPGHALAHAALAEAWTLLGYDDKARDAARQARESSDSLSATERRVVEGRYHDTNHDWERAVESYSALFGAHPGEIDYGLWLARAQTWGGDPSSALETVEKLRQLPPPASEDPRIDLAEAAALLDLGAPGASRSAAERAIRKGRAGAAPFVVGRARLHQALALQEQGTGAAIAVLAALEEARAIFENSGDRRGVAQVLDLTAYTLYSQGELKNARRVFEQALDHYRELGDWHGAAGVLLNLGNLAIDLGRATEGATLYQQSLALSREFAPPRDTAGALINIGVTYHLQGDLITALDKYREALALSEESEDAETSALIKVNLAEVHFLRGELAQARAVHGEALAYYRAADDRLYTAYNQLRLGQVFADRTDLFLARDSYLDAGATQSRLGQTTTAAETRVALAKLVLEEGDAALAEELALRAEEVLSIEGAVDLAGLAGTVLARALLAQGKLAAARAADAEARQVAEHSGDHRLRFAAAITAALVRAIADGEKVAALAELESVRNEARAAGFVHFVGETRRATREIEAGRGTATPRLPATN